MRPLSFWQSLNPIRIWRGARSIAGIHSIDQFKDIIGRERARTDRTGVSFSLVVFRLEGPKRETYRALQHLARSLVSRARTSDEVGWLEKATLSALLVGAGEAGGRKFGSAIVGAFPQELTSPTFEVFVYQGSRKGQSDGNNKEETGVSLGVPVASTAEGAMKSSMEQTAEYPVEVLPPVFARQLPLWKDILDVTAALIALTFLSPLFLVIAAYIKVVSKGPVFFKQERIGYRGKRFLCWKFRTMKPDNDATAHQEYLKSLIRGGDQSMVKLDAKKDPRIIPLGGILRQTGLDELPQLINVIKGDMSLVGPRPCLPYEAKEYDQWHTERFDTAPGLTGLWQVSGKNRTTFKDMVRFDIRYAKRMSLWEEIQILFKTFPAIAQQVRDHRAKRRESAGTTTNRSRKENA